MSLAESIGQALNGRRSGKSWYVPTICHGGDGKSLQLTDTPDGKLLARCHSHQCDYRKIMEALEANGLKDKTSFTGKQRQQHAIIKSRYELDKKLDHILILYCQELHTRLYSDEKLSEEDRKRESQAAFNLMKILGERYA